jgi:hypothetical protein
MHVVSASRRTDIPAFYTDWLMNRLAAGYCRVPNPFSRRAYTVSLRPEDVLAIIFWTKNPRPLMPHLDRIEALGYPYWFGFTVNPYDHVFERAVLPTERAVEAFRDLSRRLGPELVVWRYDPVVETTLTPWHWHLDRFAALAAALEGATRRCMFSFVNLYQRTRIRMDRLAVEHGFDYRYHTVQPEAARYSRHGRAYAADEMRERAWQLAAIAGRHGIALQSCCLDLVVDPDAGVEQGHCVDPELVAVARGEAVRIPAKPSREGCGCHASVDIGVYETCPHGCGASYCYAVQSHERAVANRRAHDPDGEFLLWPYGEAPPRLEGASAEQLGLPMA